MQREFITDKGEMRGEQSGPGKMNKDMKREEVLEEQL